MWLSQSAFGYWYYEEDRTMAKTFAGELEAIIDELQEDISRLKDENRRFRKASQEQRGLNGQLREENATLLKQLRALEPDY
jgi:FtsZ-binding cell division protein ZapB